MSSVDGFIRRLTAATTYHRDGTRTTVTAPAVWTLAHRGYSGNGRLDVWAYPSKRAALQAGADLALACGLHEDTQAVALYEAGRFEAVLSRYEQLSPPEHLLRVQAAFLQHDTDDGPRQSDARPGRDQRVVPVGQPGASGRALR